MSADPGAAAIEPSLELLRARGDSYMRRADGGSPAIPATQPNQAPPAVARVLWRCSVEVIAYLDHKGRLPTRGYMPPGSRWAGTIRRGHLVLRPAADGEAVVDGRGRLQLPGALLSLACLKPSERVALGCVDDRVVVARADRVGVLLE